MSPIFQIDIGGTTYLVSITYWNYHPLYDHLIVPLDQYSSWSSHTRAWTSILLDALDVVMLMVGSN